MLGFLLASELPNVVDDSFAGVGVSITASNATPLTILRTTIDKSSSDHDLTDGAASSAEVDPICGVHESITSESVTSVKLGSVRHEE